MVLDAKTFTCTEIRQRGPLAARAEDCTAPCSVHRAMMAADEAWRAALRAVSIADLAADVTRKSGPQVLQNMSEWLSR